MLKLFAHAIRAEWIVYQNSEFFDIYHILFQFYIVVPRDYHFDYLNHIMVLSTWKKNRHTTNQKPTNYWSWLKFCRLLIRSLTLYFTKKLNITLTSIFSQKKNPKFLVKPQCENSNQPGLTSLLLSAMIIEIPD